MTAGGREHSPEWFIHSRRAPQEYSRPAGIFARPFGIIRGWRESSQPRFGIPPAGGDIPGLWRGHSRLARGYPRQGGGHSLHSQRGRYNVARRHAGTVKTCGHPLLSGPPTLNDIHIFARARRRWSRSLAVPATGLRARWPRTGYRGLHGGHCAATTARRELIVHLLLALQMWRINVFQSTCCNFACG